MQDNTLSQDDYQMINRLVKNLLNEKPADPVPFIYNFLA